MALPEPKILPQRLQPRGDRMAFSEKLQDLITKAWDEGHVCLLGTSGKDGPNISPKGSMIVFDDQHLAYWERSKK
jgi:hypothetical protein